VAGCLPESAGRRSNPTRRLERLGLKFEQVLTEFVGVNATHGPLSGEPSSDIAEVQLRVGVRANDRAPSNVLRKRSRH
jgi:hypothetical protein